MKNLELNDDYQHFKQLEHDYIGYQSLTDVPRVLNYQDQLKDYSVSSKDIFPHMHEVSRHDTIFHTCTESIIFTPTAKNLLIFYLTGE